MQLRRWYYRSARPTFNPFLGCQYPFNGVMGLIRVYNLSIPFSGARAISRWAWRSFLYGLSIPFSGARMYKHFPAFPVLIYHFQSLSRVPVTCSKRMCRISKRLSIPFSGARLPTLCHELHRASFAFFQSLSRVPGARGQSLSYPRRFRLGSFNPFLGCQVQFREPPGLLVCSTFNPFLGCQLLHLLRKITLRSAS